MKISRLKEISAQTFTVDVGVNRRTGGKVGFTCKGVGSDEYQAGERAMEAANIREAAGRVVPLDLSKDADAGHIADSTLNRRMLLAEHCVVDWYGFDADNDTEAPLTPEALREVLTLRPQWLDAVLREVERERAF